MKSTYTSYCLLFIGLFCSLSSEGQIKRYKGDKEFSNFNYAFAIHNYKKIADRKGVDYELAKRLAESYRKTGNYEEAETWYSKAISFPESIPADLYHYAEILRGNGNYMEARNQYLRYGMQQPEQRKHAEAMAKVCETSIEWMANPSQVKVENYKSLNTEYNEFAPVYFNKQLFITTDRIEKQKEYSKRELYGWTGNPYLFILTASHDSMQNFHINKGLPDLDNSYHNGPVCFSKNGDTVYFTRSNKVKNPKKLVGKEKANEFINRLEIYFAVNRNGKWENLQPFVYNNTTQYSVGHPCLSQDGSILYFSSDMEGTLGETDIFYCEKLKDGSWSKPVNAGRTINSPGKELFPYVDSRGMLYFSSDGHDGMGGLDIFNANGAKATWKNRQNMKYPVNSSKDDFGISMDASGQSGFFSSNREGGLGGDDIYYFRNPQCVVSGLTLEMLDGKDQPLKDVMISLYKKGDTSSVIAYERTGSTPTKKVCLRDYYPCATLYNAEGTFHFNLQPGTYELKASKNGYFTHLTTIEANCQKEDTIKIALELNKIILNKPIILKDLFYNDDKLYVKRNIYYDLDKASIRYEAAMELDKVIELLKNNPDIKVELSAHTDSRHNDDYNLNLSQRRAESAVKYIISKGISKSRIIAKGYGENNLVNKCKDGVDCSEDLHQENRRTEIKVIEIREPETHIVGPYDTLYSISRKYNLKLDDIKKLNNIQDDIIYAGDVLKLK